MAKQVIFVLCAFLVVIQAKNFSPRDLADEVTEQAQELESVVTGQILVAHNGLDNMVTQWNMNSLYVAQTGTIDIQQESASIDSEITSLKDLAISAGVDPYQCTEVHEQDLARLTSTFIGELSTCITSLGVEATTMARNARYVVDVVINKVHDLQNQIRRCNGDILCLSPLITEIQLDKIRLPQNIQTEVQAVETLLSILGLSVTSCSNSAVSQYTSEAGYILNNVINCIQKALP